MGVLTAWDGPGESSAGLLDETNTTGVLDEGGGFLLLENGG